MQQCEYGRGKLFSGFLSKLQLGLCQAGIKAIWMGRPTLPIGLDRFSTIAIQLIRQTQQVEISRCFTGLCKGGDVLQQRNGGSQVPILQQRSFSRSHLQLIRIFSAKEHSILWKPSIDTLAMGAIILVGRHFKHQPARILVNRIRLHAFLRRASIIGGPLFRVQSKNNTNDDLVPKWFLIVLVWTMAMRVVLYMPKFVLILQL